MASKSEYDTFDYLKPADYLPGLKQRYAEMNQGFEDAEQIAKLNDRQRVANAEIMGKVINNAQKFSKSAAKVFKQQRDQAQEIYGREAFDLQQTIGASQSDMAAWKRDREALGEDHSTAQYLAFKATESGDSELASSLQSITGWRAQIQEETLAKRWANNWEPEFYNPETGINSKLENGNHKYSITLKGDDGQPDRVVTWDNATQSERGQLINHYNVQNGYKGVSHYRKEFATSTFWGKHERNVQNVLTKENQKDLDRQAEERIDFYKSTIIESAELGNGDFAKTIYELETKETAWLGGDRKTARLKIMEMVKKMIIDGDIKAKDATLENFTFLHAGTNTEKGLDFFKEYDEGWGDMIRDATIELDNEKAKDQKGFNIGYVNEAQAYLEENNLPLNEQTLSQITTQYKEAYFTKFGEYPTSIPPDLLNMVTIEDREDAQIEQILEDKKSRGEAIKYSDYAGIQDDKIREKWYKYSTSASGQGLTPDAKTFKEEMVDPLVQSKLNTTLGHYDHKNIEHKQMMNRANARFNVLYTKLAPTVDPDDGPEVLHNAVLKQLGDEISMWMMEPPPEPTQRTWLKDLHKGKTFLATAHKEGSTPAEALSNNLIAGSEQYYKDLEKYAANPGGAKIPSYYHKIAADIDGMSAYEVANLQYRSQTGKDLPQPIHQQHLETLNPLVRYMMVTYPSKKKAIRAKIISNKIDFNKAGVTEGVVVEEDPVEKPVIDPNFWD